ncbi:hypothetical protein niasHT_037366 [Heterodera trifolii]|uniref:G-protein coupled receptors family 1 profile domain-containing protein n=1 Tax=Heterodera trifolii TaxID=157864 RepID=A0ABD2J4U4_9BILA
MSGNLTNLTTNLTITGTIIVDWMSTGLINAGFKQFTFVCKLITALLITRLLLLARFRPAVLRVPEVSRALRIFLCFHLAGAIVTMPYNAYVPIVYYTSPSDNKSVQHKPSSYNMYALYWLGQWQNTYAALSPLVVLFLTLERCFIIKLVTTPAKRESVERRLSWAGIGTLLAAFMLSTLFFMDELPLNITELYDIGCQTVSCVMRKWDNMPQLVIKGTAGILNIFCSIYFRYSLHKLQTNRAMMKLKNHLVIVTICFAICLDFFPAFLGIVLNIFGSGLLSNVASTSTVLDSLCCAIYFSLVFVPPGWLKRRANANDANAIGGTTNIQQQRQHTQLQPHQRTNRIASTVSMMNPIVVPALNRHPRISRYSDGMIQIGTVSATVRHGR